MAKPKKSSSNRVRFRKNLNIGAPDAETDERFLEKCFVETGDVDLLVDCDDPRCIVVGRTGSGKTALLHRISQTEKNSIELPPEVLSLNYISNSNVIQFFEAVGVNLHVFYDLLWRHVITVELLKKKYGIKNEEEKTGFMSYILSLGQKDKAKERAIKYLQDWGEKFWEETEYRVKEFTMKMEQELAGNVSLGGDIITLGAKGAEKIAEETKQEIIKRSREVVDKVQVRELRDVIDLLENDIFTDRQKKYYILVDRLDEEWVDDNIRLKLIKALIETIRTFQRVHCVKIIMALRTDLLSRVLKDTESYGFQQEKYEGLYMNIRWTKEDLKEIINKRLSFLFEYQYSGQSVHLEDVLPKRQFDKQSSFDYMISRTFNRPRDIIIFFNECISEAAGQTKVTATNIRDAESAYSQKRITSICDEWRADHPTLKELLNILKRKHRDFSIRSIETEEWNNLAMLILGNADEEYKKDNVYMLAESSFINGEISTEYFSRYVFSVLYKVGVIGVKLEPHLSWQWSYIDTPEIDDNYLAGDTPVQIHPAFWSALGARPS